jgi:hypothetical protein
MPSSAKHSVRKLSDRMNHRTLLAWGLVVLIGADLVLATNDHWTTIVAGLLKRSGL